MLRERCAELTDVEERLVEAFPQHHALHPLREVRHLGQLHQELLGLIQRNYNRTQSKTSGTAPQSETSGTAPPGIARADPEELQ